MVVPDLNVDPRFSSSASPHIRRAVNPPSRLTLITVPPHMRAPLYTQPARHQVVGKGRLDFYAGTVLDLGADTDVPTASEAAIVNEDCDETAGEYEPLIALLCIFDDKPRHDFDDAALLRLCRLNGLLTPQLLKIAMDHITMRRLRLQQGESSRVAAGSCEESVSSSSANSYRSPRLESDITSQSTLSAKLGSAFGPARDPGPVGLSHHRDRRPGIFGRISRNRRSNRLARTELGAAFR